MKITVIDASNYFKGLLLLIRKDHKITDMEIQVMKRIGKTLGFEPKFCDNAINEILKNKYIEDTAPEFTTKEIAMKFIKDGLALASSDVEVHHNEQKWLKATAEKNGLDINWFYREKEIAANRKQLPSHMEVDDLIVEY